MHIELEAIMNKAKKLMDRTSKSTKSERKKERERERERERDERVEIQSWKLLDN